MNIGIIVYSVSGHTLSVATALQQQLTAEGHQVTLQRLEISGPERTRGAKPTLKSVPAIDGYDAVVFACPVHGGLPPPPMASYLQRIPSLSGQKVAFLVTHFFPRAWGAVQTIAALSRACEAKGAMVRGSGDVRWFGPGRKGRIAQALDSLIACLND